MKRQLKNCPLCLANPHQLSVGTTIIHKWPASNRKNSVTIGNERKWLNIYLFSSPKNHLESLVTELLNILLIQAKHVRQQTFLKLFGWLTAVEHPTVDQLTGNSQPTTATNKSVDISRGGNKVYFYMCSLNFSKVNVTRVTKLAYLPYTEVSQSLKLMSQNIFVKTTVEIYWKFGCLCFNVLYPGMNL